MNDRERFLNELFETEYTNLFAYCRKKLFDEQTAEDCICEVFFRAYENIEKLIIHQNPTGWLYKTAQLVCKEIIGKIRRYRMVIIFYDSIESIEDVEVSNTTEEALSHFELDIAEAKNKIISSLNERDLELYDLIYVKRLSPEELSKRTGRPIPTLRVQKSRLKGKLVNKVSAYFMQLL